MEEAAKRHAEQDEWLKKFYQNSKINREAHDKIIQGLEMKVRTLTNEVEGRANGGKLKECKAIYTEDGSPLYTPFYYSPEEIEYFSANSGFSDNERQETDKSGMMKALAALKATHEIKKVPQKENKTCLEDDDFKKIDYDLFLYDSESCTSKDEDDLEGILDYLKPRSYNGFIDLDNEAYNKRRCRLLGLTYEEPPLILIEKVMVTRYTIGPEKIYIKVKLLGIEEMPRTRDNVASIRARLMEKMANDGNGQEKM
ncbi:hypothetical protein Tco_0856048 [Tanacetum coccineum]